MRIEQRTPVAARKILADEHPQKCRLAGPGLPNDVHVGASIGSLDTEDLSVVTVIRAREVRNVIVASTHTLMIGRTEMCR